MDMIQLKGILQRSVKNLKLNLRHWLKTGAWIDSLMLKLGKRSIGITTGKKNIEVRMKARMRVLLF